MSFTSWLPSALKDLLRHVPTLLFEVISWSALTKDIAVLSKRLLTGDGVEDARRSVQAKLPGGISFSNTSSELPKTPQSRQMLGEKILALYFAQISSPGAMFLDLRLSHFGLQENQIIWNPTSLWSEFSPDFTHGLSELYAGFYNQDESRFQNGLLLTGLIQSGWSEADKNKMANLFKAHFGQDINGPMKFQLETFQQSFQAVFSFLMEKKVKLTTDFLLLGVMLVTLYLSLEELGSEYPVAKIYHESHT